MGFDAVFENFMDELKDYVADAMKETVLNASTIKRKEYIFPAGPIWETKDVCEYLNICPASLKKLVWEGKLKSLPDGTSYRFYKNHLDEYIQENFISHKK